MENNNQVTKEEKKAVKNLLWAAERSLLKDFLQSAKKKGVTAAQIADMWGVSSEYVSHMKRGFRGVDLGMILVAAKKFDIEIKIDFSNVLKN